jgi:predicted ATPase
MYITELLVENFRGIRRIHLTDLRSTVVLAGQNGCGKSCVLDAIRLLKSSYGGYQPNEWQQWFGEFQINLRANTGLRTLFHDHSRPIKISAQFRLSEPERAFLLENGASLVRRLIRKTNSDEWSDMGLAVEERLHGKEEQSQAARAVQQLQQELHPPSIEGSFIIDRDLNTTNAESVALEVLFSTYLPTNLGVIDYHGPHRNYGREAVGGVNLNMDAQASSRNHALYNYGNKYSNIKSEMAASYVRELVAERAGVKSKSGDDLTKTLQELFKTFFPGKQFSGPAPAVDGGIEFPVKLADGSQHDINELSSGEKEVLFGYLRLRNSSPRNSIILLDEPELHLNPRLTRGLPRFYQQHIGQALNTQIWLVTHSDAFLRESLGQPDFSVFHITPPHQESLSQAHAISVEDDVSQALIELTGDLATHQPDAKVVIFEGEASDFDVFMTQTLFPGFAERTNMISAGSKLAVRRLHSLLDLASKKGNLKASFHSITDRDSDVAAAANTTGSRFVWDVYHIENYLLNPKFISEVLRDLADAKSVGLDVEAELRVCAEATLDDLVRHQLERHAWDTLFGSMKLNINKMATDIAGAVVQSTASASQRIADAVQTKLTAANLAEREKDHRLALQKSLSDGSWRETFRGRDILKVFTAQHGGGLSYAHFRNMIIARMRDAQFEPAGMKAILDAILINE